MTPYHGTIEDKPIIAAGNKLYCSTQELGDPDFRYGLKLATMHEHFALGKYHAELIALRYNAYQPLVQVLREFVASATNLESGEAFCKVEQSLVARARALVGDLS